MRKRVTLIARSAKGRKRLAVAAVLLAAVLAQNSFAETDQTAAAPAAPDPGKTPHFDVGEIRVVGNSTLAPIDIERIIYPFVGPNKTIGDLNSARVALESAYHSHGYGTVFVDLPEQQIVDGLVRLKVTEGRLASVQVSGTRYFSNRQILAAMPDARVGVVPNLPKLQDEIGAVNAQTTERQVVPILKAGNEPGTVALALKVQDHLPLHASVELNNQQTEGTRALRSLFALSYDNLFGRLDQFSVQYQTAPQQPDQVGVLATNASIHLYDGGPALSMYYIDSKTNVVSAGTLGVLGKGSIYGLRLPFNLMTSADFTGTLTYGLDYKHFLQSIMVDPQTGLNTPNSYLEMSLDYSAAWRADHWQATLDTTANFGSRQLVNDTAHFALARYQGRANFFFVRGTGAMTYHLPGGLNLTGRLSGQGAVEPLVSNEYFSIAGADGVRGYLESEEFGDNALKGTFQLASPQWHPRSNSVAGDLFAFFDDGRVTFLDSLPGQPTHAELRSAGAGFEFLASQHFTSSLTWAYPLVSGPMTKAGDSRVLFVVRGSL
jgi:hemolysin activation/secretion protein